MKRQNINKPIILLFIVLLMAALACGSSASTPAPVTGDGDAVETEAAIEEPSPQKVTEEDEEEPTPTTPPTEAPPAEIYLGDTVEANGYALTAVSVADPAKPGMLYTPESGTKLVAVEIVVSNIAGKEALSVNPLYTELVAAEGFTYQAELAAVDGQLATTDLNPGEKARGWVAFEIPEGAVPARIKYQIGFFGGTELVASLTSPPEDHVAVGPSGEAEAAELSFIGDAVEYFGFAMTPMAVADPAEPSMLYTPKTGTKLVAVEVILSNIAGDEPLSVNPLNAELVDTEGFTYQAELAGVEDQIATLDLMPGERVRGWIAYQIPEDAVPAAIKYAPDWFGEAFKAGLGEPPEGHTPVAEPEAAPTDEKLSKLGEPVQGDGFILIAHAVQDPATPGTFTKPKTGMRLVAVQIEIQSQSAELSVNPLYSLLVDDKGFVYEVELGGSDGQIATTDLSDGEKVMGWVAFFIPEDAQPAAIKYGDIFSGHMVKAGLSQ